MLQESQTKEESRITLTGLAGFVGNKTRISGQIGLHGTARVTRMDTRVNGQTGLLRQPGQPGWQLGSAGRLGYSGQPG
jgi:hypothetical protein